MEVVEHVAVEGPVPQLHGRDQDRELLAGLDEDGVLARPLGLAVLQLHPHPVQMDRMGHHRLVEHRQPQPLAEIERDFVGLRVLLAIEGEDVAGHVRRHVDEHLPLHRGRRQPVSRAQLVLGQHPPAILAKPHARVGHPLLRLHRAHGDVDIVAHRHVGSRIAHHSARRRERVVHHPHPRLFETAERTLALRGQWTFHPGARRKADPRETAAVERLGIDGIGAVLAGLDDEVVGLGDADAELVGLDGLDVLAVGLDHRHRKARHAHVVMRHRRGVDDPHPDPLPRPEQRRPVRRRIHAVRGEDVALVGDVEQVGGRHAHLGPGQPVAHRLERTPGAQIGRKVAQRQLLVVVILRPHLLETAVDEVRADLGKVGQDHHHVAVIAVGLAAIRRIDDDRTVHPLLLLEPAVAVIPVGAMLLDPEPVGEGLPRRDARIVHAGHAIHLEGHEKAVPMRRGRLGQGIRHVERDVVALAQVDQRPRDRPVIGQAVASDAADGHGLLADHQVVARSRAGAVHDRSAGTRHDRSKHRRRRTARGQSQGPGGRKGFDQCPSVNHRAELSRSKVRLSDGMWIDVPIVYELSATDPPAL